MSAKKRNNVPKSLKLYIRKPGTTYWVRGTVAGINIRESTGTSSATHAEAYRIKREAEILDTKFNGKRERVTFSEAAESYLLTSRPATVQHMRHIHDYFGKMYLDEIDQKAVNAFVAKRLPGAKASTITRYLGCLISVIRHGTDAGWCLPHKIKLPKAEPRQPTKYADDAWFEKVLPWAKEHDPELLACVLIMTTTGARVSEALRITPRHIDRKQNTALLAKTKNGKPRLVPLTDETLTAINALPKYADDVSIFGPKIGRSSIDYKLKLAAAHCGVELLSSHKVGRHAFAARMLKRGASLKLLAEAGGWASTTIPDRVYGHIAKADVQAAMLASQSNLTGKGDV